MSLSAPKDVTNMFDG